MNSNAAASKIDPYLIEVLGTESKHRSIRAINKLVQYLKTLHFFISYLHANTLLHENNILVLLSNQLKYSSLMHNAILKKACEKESCFYLILSGKVAEFGFKYDKLFITEEEYMIHLIKLSLLNEDELLNETIRMNKHIFNIAHDVVAWARLNKPQSAHDYIARAEENINKAKSLAREDDITNYVNITNPFINSTRNNNSRALTCFKLNSNTQYPLTLPSYVYIRTLSTGQYVGTLSLNRRHKCYSTFVAIDDTELGVLEKFYPSNPHFYSLIDDQIRYDLSTVIDSFFIFQTISRKYFDSVICPQFAFRKISQGEFILREQTHYEGVFLIKSGFFKVTAQRKYDELSELIVDLKHSLDSYTNYLTDIKDNLIEDFPQQNFISNGLYRTQEYLCDSKVKKEISLCTIQSKQVIGLSEFFNYKSDIIHFNAICLSETAEVFFLPKESFMSIISRELSAQERSAKVIEQNAKYYIQTIRRYKEQALKDLKASIAKNSKRNEMCLGNLSGLLKSKILGRGRRKLESNRMSKINSVVSVMTDIVPKENLFPSRKMKRSFSQEVLSGVTRKEGVDEPKKMFNSTFNEKLFQSSIHSQFHHHNINEATTSTLYPTLFSGFSNKKPNKFDREPLLIKIMKRTKQEVFPKSTYYVK